MDVSSIINLATTLMGYIPGRSSEIQKNVADDVMIKLLNMMTSNKYSGDEIKRLINNLTVDKIHKPNRRRLRIWYGEVE